MLFLIGIFHIELKDRLYLSLFGFNVPDGECVYLLFFFFFKLVPESCDTQQQQQKKAEDESVLLLLMMMQFQVVCSQQRAQ